VGIRGFGGGGGEYVTYEVAGLILGIFGYTFRDIISLMI